MHTLRLPFQYAIKIFSFSECAKLRNVVDSWYRPSFINEVGTENHHVFEKNQ